MSRDFWQGRRVLITGASGFMGGWLTKSLVERGADVVALIRDMPARCLIAAEGILPRLTRVDGNVENFPLLRRTLSEYGIETLFHLAAQPLVGVAKADPIDTLDANIRGTWNVLEAARLCGTGQVVFASSDKAYGASEHLPYTEAHPLQGRHPYDASKSCADLLCQMYASTYRLPVIIARCANLFGGGDYNFSRAIPGAIRSALRGEPFVIRSDGKFVRDFLYVKDGVTAYMRLAEALAADTALAGEAFNFSMEVRLNVLELVELVLSIVGRTDLRPRILNQAASEIREQYLCCAKARSALGWWPKFCLETALEETVAWYRAEIAASQPANACAPSAGV